MTAPLPPSAQVSPAVRGDADGALSLIYVDRSLIVVDKPARLLSVPGRGPDKQDCLIARIRDEFPDALIVHRLDYDTSGLIVLARGAKKHRALSLLFQERHVEKRYVAVVEGRPAENEGEIDLPLIVDWPNRPLHKVDFAQGKPARTRYRVIGHDDARCASRVALTPETGRTHQLRVHMLALGHPILGDPLYAHADARAKADRLLLHAERLAFPHPATGRRLVFSSGAPF
ncbi:MAG: RluA family pseudouridine synthase [Candidatus Accumulibacter sp.]|jgi:tRNA pseudouridine32 synthase/23S rRNA pseudouridine746 synthase|nr:RluA family pseudouridine synthase [Accumulibacter sp.]